MTPFATKLRNTERPYHKRGVPLPFRHTTQGSHSIKYFDGGVWKYTSKERCCRGGRAQDRPPHTVPRRGNRSPTRPVPNYNNNTIVHEYTQSTRHGDSSKQHYFVLQRSGTARNGYRLGSGRRRTATCRRATATGHRHGSPPRVTAIGHRHSSHRPIAVTAPCAHLLVRWFIPPRDAHYI